jgi:hypothetical protein
MASVRERGGAGGTKLFSCAIVLTIVPMSREGVTGFTTLHREESVVVSRIVRGSPQDVERALFAPPRFDRVLPPYLLEARGGLLLGVPVDLYLVWVCLWGLVAALAFPSLSMLRLLLLALVIDLALMPAASPVVALGPSWLAGETAGLLFGLLPGQMLARWTARDECLIGRAILQAVAFSGLVMFVLPAVVIDGSGSAWSNPLSCVRSGRSA